MTYTETQKKTLLTVARQSIEYGLQKHHPKTIEPKDYDPLLREIRATFVTLKIAEHLRGCVGTTEAREPLVKSVANSAYSSAFHDSRFTPLVQSEFRKIGMSISILTPPKPIEFESELDLIDQLTPNSNGLIIQADGDCSATFLPSVWKSIPEPKAFLAQLKIKAGLLPDKTVKHAWRYNVTEIKNDLGDQ